MYIEPPQDEYKRYILQNIENWFLEKNIKSKKKQEEICGCSRYEYINRRSDPGLFRLGELLNCCRFFGISLLDLVDDAQSEPYDKKCISVNSEELYYFLLFERIDNLSRLKKKPVKRENVYYGINQNVYYGYTHSPNRITLDYLLKISKGLGITLSELLDVETEYKNYMLLQGKAS